MSHLESLKNSFARRLALLFRSMRWPAVWLVDLYRLTLSGLLGGRCRFTPSCSVYFRDSVAKYGLFHGLRMGIGRLCRCHPWGSFGYDPVEKRSP